MSENLSLDETIAKLKAEAQETLKNILAENKQRFEKSLQSRQQHIIEKLNPHLIKFNVGGFKFVTTLNTLSNIKDTKLHKMVTGRYHITLDKKNRIFIDRNGQYFGHVLDCVRKGKVELPATDSFLSSRVQREYEFFELIRIDSSSSTSQTKVNTAKLSKSVSSGFGSKTAVTPVLQVTDLAPIPKSPGAQYLAYNTSSGVVGTQPISLGKMNTKGNYTWRFSSQIEGELGVDSGPERITIEAKDVEAQTIGDSLLDSGTHQWRFFVEEIIPEFLPNGIENDAYCEGIVTFGVVTKQIWKKIKETGGYDMVCGFNTMGETFKVDTGSKKNKGLKIDGSDQVAEITCKNKEIMLTFDTKSGVLKLTFKGEDAKEKSHMLRINESEGNKYYPYFHIENARVRLLETKELVEDETHGMDFMMEQAVDNDDNDYEDIESDEKIQSNIFSSLKKLKNIYKYY